MTEAAARRVVPNAFTVSLDDVGLTQLPSVGGKGANLGEMRRARFPVPEGFVVTVDAYLSALDASAMRARTRKLFAETDVDDAESLREHSRALQAVIEAMPMPRTLTDQIAAQYQSLGAECRVAVRSSATSEDTAGCSFAGMHETLTNVRGEAELLSAIKRCWMSLWNERVLAYRKSRELTEEPALAVVVQRMVDADFAGVMFTADPTANDRERVVIEAAFGL
ncbi:MAG TPA: PEP/pyruvate-binding domain-containing protein, partial [Polyangiales bacterium]|nr:PEP/pyruvate-binding domain-containing protein [Polyangiales bacterium]